ncbi:putative MFS metabolite transporter [Azoarcus olearius]|uniref:MFS transporter n=1 Tax=Azoarcus sp. (strain BH72) TaxID=418699 RepID=UPI0008062784|nr:MFS transporter [Azoarcus olearius]ANQ84202.1 putative MFS metabolite transporter [Azoarcus olearius]
MTTAGGSGAGLPYWRLSAYYFSYFAFVGAFSPYFTLYLKALDFSATDIAVLMSLMQVMRVLAPNLWGWLAEHLGVRLPIVRLSALMSVAGFAVFFFTESFSGIFAGMALMSFFWAAALPLVESLTFAHLATAAHRYGSIRAWGSVGFIAAVVGLGALLDLLPIRAVLWGTTAVLGAILVCSLLLPEAARAATRGAGASLREVLGRSEVKALLGACFLMSAAHGAFYVFFSILLVDHGYGKAAVGALWALGVVSEIIVFMFMPRLMRRVPLRAILLFAFCCAVVRFVLTGWGAASVAVVAAAQVLHGVTFGAYHAAAIAAINRWFSGRLQARGQALYGSLSFGAGGMLGGLVSGLGWETIGPAWTFTLGSVFALAGLLWLKLGWRPGLGDEVAGARA